jgi:hypothetical protein
MPATNGMPAFSYRFSGSFLQLLQALNYQHAHQGLVGGPLFLGNCFELRDIDLRTCLLAQVTNRLRLIEDRFNIFAGHPMFEEALTRVSCIPIKAADPFFTFDSTRKDS